MNESEIQSIKQQFGIVGNSPLLNHAIHVAAQVAGTDMTVLITGESGSGKESFSKIIHRLSHRKHGRFIAVNCGAIPEGTIDSELFGHEKGSFTGAQGERKGYFEVTDGGTIFLDEIGEMPIGTQARLLRVLENGEFLRVGSSKVQKTDVRVVTATNVDLYKRVQDGKFREDLYYRLNTVPIFVPPLRDRGADIYLLFRKFAADFAEKYRVTPVKLDEEAQVLLEQTAFPGNIRQLKNLAEQISVLETDRMVDTETMKKYLPKQGTSTLPALIKGIPSSKDFSEREILYKVLFDMKHDMNELKKLVLEILRNGGSISSDLIMEKKALFEGIEIGSKEVPKKNHSDEPLIIRHGEAEESEEEKIEDIIHEAHEESLSLSENEKELIIKALEKNNNKRKYAAKDLEISERTLYRKIKQYNLDA